MKCPNYSGQAYFEVPFKYRFQVVAPAGGASCVTLAPYNEVIASFTNCTKPWGANPAGTLTTSYVADPFLYSMFFINPEMARCTSFCVEVNYVGLLNNTAGVLRCMKWQLPNLAYMNSNPTEANFNTVYGVVATTAEADHIGAADLLAPKCVHTGMLDRDALDFTRINSDGLTGITPVYATAWAATYGASTRPDIPFAPIVIFIDPSSSAGATLEFVVKGSFDVRPDPAVWFSRLAKTHYSSILQEDKWWNYQRAMIKQRFVPVKGAGLASFPVVERSLDAMKSKVKTATVDSKGNIGVGHYAAASALGALAGALANTGQGRRMKAPQPKAKQRPAPSKKKKPKGRR